MHFYLLSQFIHDRGFLLKKESYTNYSKRYKPKKKKKEFKTHWNPFLSFWIAEYSFLLEPTAFIPISFKSSNVNNGNTWSSTSCISKTGAYRLNPNSINQVLTPSHFRSELSSFSISIPSFSLLSVTLTRPEPVPVLRFPCQKSKATFSTEWTGLWSFKGLSESRSNSRTNPSSPFEFSKLVSPSSILEFDEIQFDLTLFVVPLFAFLPWPNSRRFRSPFWLLLGSSCSSISLLFPLTRWVKERALIDFEESLGRRHVWCCCSCFVDRRTCVSCAVWWWWSPISPRRTLGRRCRFGIGGGGPWFSDSARARAVVVAVVVGSMAADAVVLVVAAAAVIGPSGGSNSAAIFFMREKIESVSLSGRKCA